MELGRLWKLSIPEIKMYRRKTGTWSIRTQSFCQENPKAGDINYGVIVHVNDQGRNMDIQDVIARLCYRHRAELSMHFLEGLDGRRLMEHLSAKDEVLTLAGISLGSGELHQDF